MPSRPALETLRLADPDTYVRVSGRIELIEPPPPDGAVERLVQEIIWALSLESAMGASLADGMLALLAGGASERLGRYTGMVHRAAETGVTLGRIVAEFSPAPVMAGEPLTAKFEHTMAVMLKKGTYTLTAPFEVLRELLQAGDTVSASIYLDLLAETFRRDLTYNQSLQLVYHLPRSVRRFTERRRMFQLEKLISVMKLDLKLVEAYLDGIEGGAGLLDEVSLSCFVSEGLKRYERKPEAGIKFLSLASKVGQDACLALQRVVPLGAVSGALNRYLNARLGRSIGVLPLSDLGAEGADIPWVCSDGRSLYIRNEIDRFDRRQKNIDLIKGLARLEAAFLECRTFDFDLERAADRYPGFAETLAGLDVQEPSGGCDGERFVKRFPNRQLADDLFSLYEHARVDRFILQHYPGLARTAHFLLDADTAGRPPTVDSHLLEPVISELLRLRRPQARASLSSLQRELIDLFETETDAQRAAGVEHSAFLAARAYVLVTAKLKGRLRDYRPARFPLGRRPNWPLISRSLSANDGIAGEVKRLLDARNIKVYRSDLRGRLDERGGKLSVDDVTDLALRRDRAAGRSGAAVRISTGDLEAVLRRTGVADADDPAAAGDAIRYPEWDNTVQDYLFDHTRVREANVSGAGGDAGYRQILSRYGGLVSRMRHAFELLKPEGLAILRQWPEGDAFDYRALLDYALDRRAGRMPSDRLFIKRLKQERDVGVMLLVDMSRSTANPVADGHASVLDVTREAIVLFCEALNVVGDRYAVAGFSGSGRHSVDFFPIKPFGEPLGEAVRARISALTPQRSTRMGAAVRHATHLLGKVDSRVRLLIVISDGFPNDLGYKADYAIADTRRAIAEARSNSIHVKAVTVNIGSDPGLDALYGRFHHHVIGDVRELPDKLLRLYGTLTRY